MRRPAWIADLGGRDLARRVWPVALVGFGYFGLAVIGTVLVVQPSGFAIIWPATAFLVGALLLTERRWWWAYLFGLVPAHLVLANLFEPGAPPIVVASQLLGNVALALATALAVMRVDGGRLSFSQFKGLRTYVALAGVAAPAVVNALILCVHMASGWATSFWEPWREWMLASIFPAVTITPLMVLLARDRAMHEAQARIEVTLAAITLFVVSYLAFGPGAGEDYFSTLLLIPIPFFLWAAVRWGVAGAAVTLLAFAAAIIARALQGAGPFAQDASSASLVSLQVFLTAISAPTILLAALMADRRKGEMALRRSQAQMDVAAAATDTGLWQWDEALGQLWMTDHCREMFGLPDEPGQRPSAFLAAVHPEDRARVSASLGASLTGGDRSVGDFRVMRGGGERRFVMRTHTDLDAEARTVRVSGVFRDVTEWLSAKEQAEQLTRRLLTLQDDERKAIAEALHDTTIQHLVAVELTLSRLKRRRPMAADTVALLDDIRVANSEAIKELRAFTYLLRPPDLEAEGLAAVLRRYVRGFGLRTGLTTRLRVTPRVDELSMEHQRALMRVTQESLANVYRHADATRVSLDVRVVAGELHLIIRDDGRGLPDGGDGDGPARLGVGIPGMAARIRQLGGKIDIRSGPKGATVHVVTAREALLGDRGRVA